MIGEFPVELSLSAAIHLCAAVRINPRKAPRPSSFVHGESFPLTPAAVGAEIWHPAGFMSGSDKKQIGTLIR